MDEDKLKEAGALFLQEMTKILQEGKDFVLEQAPDVIQQYIAWGYAKAIIGICIGGLLIIIGFIFRIFNKKLGDDGGDASTFFHIAGYVLIITGLVVGIFWTFEAVHIAVAPKPWLIEEFMNTLRPRTR